MKYKRKEVPLGQADPRAANMTAAIYVRKSTATEGKSKSRDEQLDICKVDAERIGFKRVQIYMEEEGVKGHWWWNDSERRNPEPHRSELSRLVRDVMAGKIQAVVVYKVDRLVRDTGVADALHKLFRQYDVRFICQGRDQEIDSARGLYQAALDSAAAQQWKETISEEIKRDHDYKFKLRMFTRNPSCFGFRSAGRESQAIVPVYEEIALVERIFRMFLGVGCQALGPYQIANVFAKEGISVTTGSKGHKNCGLKRVQGTSIRQILQNPMYAGIWQHNGERAYYDKLLVEPQGGGDRRSVIPEDWYHRAAAKLSSVAPTGRKANTSKKLLSGLVICGACGRVCHPNTKNLKNGSKVHRWICPYRYGATKSCFGPSYSTIVVEELDKWVVEHLIPFLAQEFNWIKNEGKGLELANHKKSLELKLSEAREKETDCLKRYLGVIDDEQFKSLAQSLLADRQEIERQLMEVNGQLGGHELNSFEPAELVSQDPQLIKEALKRFVRWIAISDQGVTVLTSIGTYFGARFQESDPQRFRNADNRRTILPPDLSSTLECLSWLKSPRDFVAGRRNAYGKVGVGRTDDELLPGAEFGELNAA